MHGAVHFAAAIVLFFATIPAAALALARRFRHYRVFAAWSTLTAAASPVLLIATVASGHLLGVMERILIGLALAGLTAVAVRLHQGKLRTGPAR